MVKEEEEEKKTKVPQGVKKDETPKISDAFKKMTKVDPQGKKQSDYDRKLLEFLASQFVPFYVVDSEEFKAFVEELDKTINLKCSRTYSRQMEDLAIEVLAEVKKAVEEYCKWSCAITTDLWTSRARDSYISVTLHFVDKLFRLHRFLSVCFSVDNEKEKVNNTSDHNIDPMIQLLFPGGPPSAVLLWEDTVEKTSPPFWTSTCNKSSTSRKRCLSGGCLTTRATWSEGLE